MNDHQPLQTDGQSKQTADRPEKKPWFNQGWLWLIVAVIGLGVIYFGFSGVTQQLAQVNHSIQQNTAALNQQSGILSGIQQELQHLIIAIKDSVSQLILANHS